MDCAATELKQTEFFPWVGHVQLDKVMYKTNEDFLEFGMHIPADGKILCTHLRYSLIGNTWIVFKISGIQIYFIYPRRGQA